MDDVPSPTASEAVPVIALTVHGEAHVLIIVEGAMGLARRRQLHVRTDELDQINLFEVVDQSDRFPFRRLFYNTLWRWIPIFCEDSPQNLSDERS